MLNQGKLLDGKYEIIKVLGQGGMGTVYLCKNSRLGNLWAVKEVNNQYANQIDLLAEPNILKNLSHIGIIRIIDIFHEEDNLYIVEDYVEGMTLKEYVDLNGPMSSELVEDISLQLCSILDYLHSFNPPIVYRDLKPSNIMVKPFNKVVLIDFGTARTYKENQEGDTMILGSMGYIAPEQLVNAQSNAQTDLYSLGATMFFMLTGKSGSPTEIMLDANYPEKAAEGLIRVIQKASAVDPASRYSDVKLMMSELGAEISDEEYDKTMLINSHETFDEPSKTVLLENKKSDKKSRLIPIPLLASLIVFAIFLASIIGNTASDAKASESTVSPKAVEKVEPKEAVEQDTVVTGILDINNPVRLSKGDGEKDKGKGKKDNNVQFVLDPPASVSNTKLSVSLTSIESVDQDVIAVLSIQNNADADLKMDLSKTFLLNGDNESANADNSDSSSLIPIPQSSGNQELRLRFKEFDFDGSRYTFRTVLSSAVNKDIDLNIDIEGMSDD